MWNNGTSGKRNASLDFDGTDDYITISDPGADSVLDFDSGDTITLSAWIKPPTLPSSTSTTVIAKGGTDGTDQANYILQISNTGSPNRSIEFCFRNSGNTIWNCWRTTNGYISTNSWQPIALSYTFGSASSIKAYYNGLQKTGSWTSGNGNNAPYVANTALWIGADNLSGGGSTDEEVDGQIDDVKIFNYALTADQIKKEYNDGAVYFGPNTGSP